jgi:hypothetical protein
MKAQGLSLIELTVGAALMGLLFLSGLQLLSSLFSVQAHLMPSRNALSFEPLLLKTQLQQALQEANTVEVSPEHLSLHFQNQEGAHQVRFQNISHSWALWQDQIQLAHWPISTDRQKPGFTLSSDNLLEITLPTEKTPVRIWLRNYDAT